MNDEDALCAAIVSETSGWVAVGLDPETRMQGANFVLGYVADGATVIQDMFGNRPAGPDSHPADEQLGGTDDILAFGGSEQDGLTTIEFCIPLDSGDEYDKPLVSGTSYPIILAFGAGDDPNSYHSARGYAEISLD
jgi:hypothetical protein